MGNRSILCDSYHSILIYINPLICSIPSGFHIRLVNRSPCRATSIELRLPDNTFWLQLLVARQKEMVCPGQPGNRLCETLPVQVLVGVLLFVFFSYNPTITLKNNE